MDTPQQGQPEPRPHVWTADDIERQLDEVAEVILVRLPVELAKGFLFGPGPRRRSR